MSWVESGRPWGERAADWAYLVRAARRGRADARRRRAGVRWPGTAQVINEFPDLDLAVRALAAAGPSWPALRHAGQDRFAEAMRAALRPLYTESLGVRIVLEFGWVIGTVPSA